MTGRRHPVTERELDAILATWLGGGPDTTPSEAIADRALRQIAGTRQAGRMSVLRSTLAGSPMAWGAVAMAAAMFGLALVFGSGLVGDNEPAAPSDRIEDVTPSQTSVPSEPPTSGTFESETSLGRIEWTRVTSGEPIWPWKTWGGEILGRNVDDGTIWMLSEAPAWEAGAVDELGAAATHLGASEGWAVVSPDGYGVMMGPASSRQVISRDYTDGGDEAIYRREGSDWISVQLPSTSPALPSGLRSFGPRFQGAAALDDGSWIVPAIHHVEVPWGEIFGQFPDPGVGSDALGSELVDPWPVWIESQDQLRIVEPGDNPFGGSALANLTVAFAAGDRSVIEFRDASTGELVHAVSGQLPGWSPEALLSSLKGWGLEDVSFLVYRDGTITVVRPPWPMGEEWSDSSPIVTGSGRYYVTSLPLGTEYAATGINLWESTDGIAWTRVGLPDAATADVDWVELAGRADGLLMAVHGASGPDSVWRTADGREWTRAEVPSTGLTAPVETDFGWLMPGPAAISADGATWETIELPLLPGEPTLGYLGGLFLYGPGLDGGEHVTWIGRIQP